MKRPEQYGLDVDAFFLTRNTNKSAMKWVHEAEAYMNWTDTEIARLRRKVARVVEIAHEMRTNARAALASRMHPWDQRAAYDECLQRYQEDNARLREQLAELRHDRDALAENLRDIRDAVWRLGTNEMLQRYNEDRAIQQEPTEVPNAETRAAIEASERGEVTWFDNTNELMADLDGSTGDSSQEPTEGQDDSNADE